MIVKNQYPICEFDTNKNPIIHPASFLPESLPKKMCDHLLEEGIRAICRRKQASDHWLP